MILLGGLCTCLLGLALTSIIRAFAYWIGIVATPRQDRWHKKTTPLLGGVAIYLAFGSGYLLFVPQPLSFYPILISGTLLFLTGLIDDIIQIKPYTKLIIQLIAAAWVVYIGLHLPWTGYKAINDVITIFWLVGITNALNLLDNMDGLAGGITFISCVFLTITFLLNGQTPEALISTLLGGAVLGFLVFNFHPASIFMGDSGSMFLGFMLGGIALFSDYGRSRNLIAVLFTPVLILMIPIFDTCVVTITRKLSGRSISQGGQDHTSHRLVALGMSERRAVLLLYLFATASGVLALMVRMLRVEAVLLLVPGFALTILFLGLYLGKVRIHEGKEYPVSRNTIVNALANFYYKRRVFEILLDVVLVVMAYYGAYVLRWDAHLPDQQLAIFIKTLPLMIMIQMPFFLLGGVYSGLWRYMGIDDLIVIAKSILIGTITSSVIVFTIYRFQGPSRGVLVLNALLLLMFVSASRLSFRLLRVLMVGRSNLHPNAKPILIYGAGDGGELLIREILNNPDYCYLPVGFVDDDARKTGKLIHGCRIFDTQKLPDLIRTYGVKEVLVSSSKVPESKLDYLRTLGVNLKRLQIRIE
jgi:UDP-GlcNAc:undecaprenyl-phosphate GlcNAc-1-phosphate transferase